MAKMTFTDKIWKRIKAKTSKIYDPGLVLNLIFKYFFVGGTVGQHRMYSAPGVKSIKRIASAIVKFFENLKFLYGTTNSTFEKNLMSRPCDARLIRRCMV